MDVNDHPAACWTTDGRSVVVSTASAGDFGLDVVSIDGTQSRRIIPADNYIWPYSVHGERILYVPPSVITDIFLGSVTGDARPEGFLATDAGEDNCQFSPDGRWVAYVSDETGRRDVFVAAFPQPGGRWQVSQGGGTEPRWNRNGGELFYFDPEHNLISVDIEPVETGFRAGASRKLFQHHGAGGLWRYDVSPDGERFLVTIPPEEQLASPVTLMTDWAPRAGDR